MIMRHICKLYVVYNRQDISLNVQRFTDWNTTPVLHGSPWISARIEPTSRIRSQRTVPLPWIQSCWCPGDRTGVRISPEMGLGCLESSWDSKRIDKNINIMYIYMYMKVYIHIYIYEGIYIYIYTKDIIITLCTVFNTINGIGRIIPIFRPYFGAGEVREFSQIHDEVWVKADLKKSDGLHIRYFPWYPQTPWGDIATFDGCLSRGPRWSTSHEWGS